MGSLHGRLLGADVAVAHVAVGEHGAALSTSTKPSRRSRKRTRSSSDGGLVEVGCQGGIGRTGVVIACFAIMDGIAPGEAVQWVRDRYIMRAVETPIQEWWVEWFGAQHLGTTPPPRPKR